MWMVKELCISSTIVRDAIFHAWYGKCVGLCVVFFGAKLSWGRGVNDVAKEKR